VWPALRHAQQVGQGGIGHHPRLERTNHPAPAKNVPEFHRDSFLRGSSNLGE
jgi:hypothetical protein